MNDVVSLIRQTRTHIGIAGEAVRDIDRQLEHEQNHGIDTAINIALGQLELADVLAKKAMSLFNYRTRQERDHECCNTKCELIGGCMIDYIDYEEEPYEPGK